jgi:hypothetical protein
MGNAILISINWSTRNVHVLHFSGPDAATDARAALQDLKHTQQDLDHAVIADDFAENQFQQAALRVMSRFVHSPL